MVKLFGYLCSSYLTYFWLLVFCLSQNLASAQAKIQAQSISDKIELPTNLKEVLDTRSFMSVGETTFSILFWDLYTSQLLTTSGKYPVKIASDSVLFTIHYLADISSDDLIGRTVEQWQHLGIPSEKYQSYLPALKTIWPDIKEGDSLSLLIDQGRSVFYFNQAYIGVINASEFGQVFLAIWLAENTSEPKLRRELLGIITDE
jgi:hypothetical protein